MTILHCDVCLFCPSMPGSEEDVHTAPFSVGASCPHCGEECICADTLEFIRAENRYFRITDPTLGQEIFELPNGKKVVIRIGEEIGPADEEIALKQACDTKDCRLEQWQQWADTIPHEPMCEIATKINKCNCHHSRRPA